MRGPKSAPVEGEHELFGFLTTEDNAIVASIHAKAMPAILTTTKEFDLWLEGETVEALKLQRPLPDGMLKIVALGEKEDGAELFDRWREPAANRNVSYGPAPGGRLLGTGHSAGRAITAANAAAFQSWRPLNHAGLCQGGQLARFVEARDKAGAQLD